jgi:retron-type reverse transcriptase
MKTYSNLYDNLCSYDNLFLAYKKARKHKTLKPYVIEFERDLKNNLNQLRTELLLHSYKPRPLKTFVLRDPKTRKISKSDFRDRVVHHALCNIIEPILEKQFIHDSYANRKGKGTLAAIKSFEYFKRKVSRNFTTIKDSKNVKGFVLKADVRKFFDTGEPAFQVEVDVLHDCLAVIVL